MRIKKIYFNRLYNQWKGEPLYVEDGLRDDCLYVRIMDVKYEDGSINAVTADFKDLNGYSYSVLGETDYKKRLAIFKIPLSILSNNGIYEVAFSISYNSKDTDKNYKKTAIQTFEIVDAIESDDEAIQNDPKYPILTDLINQLANYKIDMTAYPKKEEVNEMIDLKFDDFPIDKIIEKIQKDGYITQDKVNEILRDYVKKFDLGDYAKRTDLNKYVSYITFNNALDRYILKKTVEDNYVLKENGKQLSTHDFTDELYNKLIGIDINNIEIDLHEYQKIVDNNLDTNNKEITKAINEVNKKIPTKTSQLNNDSNYVARNELHNHNNMDILNNITYFDINRWNNKSDFSGRYNDLEGLPKIPSKTSELINDSNYVNNNYVLKKIAEASLPNKEVDLSAYATKDFVIDNLSSDVKNLTIVNSSAKVSQNIIDYLNEIVKCFLTNDTIRNNKIKYYYILRGKINPLDDEFKLSVNDEYYTNVSYISMLNIECKVLTTFLFANEGMIRLETPVETIVGGDGVYINLSVAELGSVYLNNNNNNIDIDDIVQSIISDDRNNLSEFKTYSNSMIENRLLEVNTDITEVSDNLDGMGNRVDYLEQRETYLTEALNNIHVSSSDIYVGNDEKIANNYKLWINSEDTIDSSKIKENVQTLNTALNSIVGLNTDIKLDDYVTVKSVNEMTQTIGNIFNSLNLEGSDL